MITREQAEHIARKFAGAPADDPRNGWGLDEFGAGWLIREKRLEADDAPRSGAGSYVIERAGGRLLFFPSYIPPRRILEEYDKVVANGFPEDPATPSDRTR